MVFFCLLSLSLVWAFDPADPARRSKSPTAVEIPVQVPEPSQTPAPQNRDELFMEVFKKPPPKVPLEMAVPLVVQGKSFGKISMSFLDDRTDFFFPSSPVMAALSDILKSDILEEVGKKIDPQERLSKRSLEEVGITVAFDKRRFLLSILVPDDLQGTQIHHITGIKIDPVQVDALPPNPFSGYVNMNAREGWCYPQGSGISNDHRNPMIVDFDSAWNWHGLVLEGSASYLESYEHPLQRGDVRLVYDNPKDLLRYSAGDLKYPIVGYQTTVNMGGIGVSRDFSLQPYINAYPVSQFEFYLDTQATVDVWVNETLTGTLRLAPGTHDIRDFPFSNGQNEVRIVITDIYGRIQVLRFSFIQDTSLLASGLSQFSYNVGLRSTIIDNSYRYATDEPALSLFYRKGYSDVFTMGGYLQGLPDQGLAGFEGIYAVPLGEFTFDTALSAVKDGDQGLASKFTFTHKPNPNHTGSDVSWQLGIEYLGHGFTRITDPSPDEDASLNLSSFMIIPLGSGFSSGIGAGYTFARGGDASDQYTLSGSINKTWCTNLNSNLTVQYRRDRDGKINTDVFFGLVWMFPNQNQSVALSMASGGRRNMQWDYNQSTSVPERVYASVTSNHDPALDQYEAKLGYVGNRGIVELSQRYEDLHSQGNHDHENQTDITLQSALVYVDGNWALSRPVSQGFVLVKGVKNLQDSEIAINPSSDGYQAVSGRHDPAVLPSLTPYNVKKIEVQPLDPPSGYLVEKPFFTLFPTYKCGYALYVGSDSMVVVIGRLVDGTRGDPFGHQSIEVVSLDNKKAQALQTFTNRKGQFQLLGLKPGNYEIRPDESAGMATVTFQIPEGTEGIYRIGSLTLPKKP
jgi:outer membrane usher protein